MEELEVDQSGQARRWVFTINNPLSEMVEDIDITKTDLPIRENYYSTAVMLELKATDCFDFKYVKIAVKKDEFETEEFIVERPFFKSYKHIEKYISSIEHLKYSVFQMEQGENETKHIQGGIFFTIGKRFKTVKDCLPFAHLEKAKGTNTQVRDYCTKKDTRIEDPVEIGEFVEERARTDRKEFVNLILSGASDSELMQLDSSNFLATNDNKIARIRESRFDHYRRLYRSVDVTFIYGPSGVGKTTYLARQYTPEQAFDVTNYDNSMFSNYNYQDVIILDEFVGNLSCRAFNLLVGFKPVDLRGLGCAKVSAYHHVYIISNYDLPTIIRKMTNNDHVLYKTIDRRINRIVHFKSENEIVIERDSEWEEVSEKDKALGLTKQVVKTWQLDSYGYKSWLYDRYKTCSNLEEIDSVFSPFAEEDKQTIINDNGEIMF